MLRVLLVSFSIAILAIFNSFGQKKNAVKESPLVLGSVFKERVRWPEIYAGDSNTVFVKCHYNRWWITSYDVKNSKVSGRFKLNKVLKMAGNGKKKTKEKYSVNGNLVVVTEDHSRKTDEYRLFYTVISKSGEILTPTTEFFLTTAKNLFRINLSLTREKGYFILQSKVIIDKNDEEELVVAKYDNNFKELNQIKINTKDIREGKEGDFEPPIFGFSDSLFMINFFEEDREKRSLKPVTTAYAYSASGKLLFSQELNENNIALTGYKAIKVGKENRLVTYYSDDNSSGIDGSITYFYSPKENKFIVKERNKIPTSIKADFTTKRRARKDKSIEKFAFSDSKLNENGELITINEQTVRVEITGVDSKGISSSSVYHTTGSKLLVEKYDSIGNIKNYSSLRTPIITTGAPSQTFRLVKDKNDLGVYFIADAKVIPRSMRGSFKNYKRRNGLSFFTYNLKDKSDKKWTTAKVPVKKGFDIQHVEYVNDCNKSFVIVDNRPPKILAIWWNVFGGKYKTQIGYFNVSL